MPCAPTLSAAQPVLPSELFNTIINELVQEAELPYSKSCNCSPLLSDPVAAEKALKACSLVSKEFMAMSRPHLFRRVRVDAGFRPLSDIDVVSGRLCSMQPENTQLERLVPVLEATPHIADYVRELIVDNDSDFPDEEPDLPRNHIEALLRFPFLTSLTIQQCSEPNDFVQRLLDTYLPLQTLTCLELIQSDCAIAFASISAAANLQTLYLRECDIRAFTGPILDTIKHLYIAGMSTPNFHLSFLSHFPSLITLWITEDYNAETPNMFFKPGTADRRCPSLHLERLHLDAGSISEGIFAVLKFFQDHAKRQGKKAFEGLQDLTVALANDDDLEGLKSVLGDGPRLKSLRVDDATHGVHRGPNPTNFHLNHHLLTSLPTLTSLHLTIPPVVHSPDEDAWNSVSDVIYSLLSFVAGRNVVEVLTLNIQILFGDQFVPPPPAYWTQIAKIAEILASSSKFPMIKEVSVEMDFAIADYTSGPRNIFKEENVEEGDMKSLQEQLGETFQELATRLGSKLKLRVQGSPP